MKYPRYRLESIALPVILIIGFFAGFAARWLISNHHPAWPILAQTEQILASHGLSPLPEPPQLEYGMIRGMLQAYNDPYTSFVEPVQHELETNTLEGSFGGIGVRLGRNANNLVVLYPLPESPAAQAGVLENDRLVQVEDTSILPETPTEEIQALLRGASGSQVRISISRPPQDEVLVFTIRREEFPLPSVTSHLHPDQPLVGIIEVNVIAASTEQEIQAAVADLVDRGAEAFILDLRDNFGGLLTAGVDIARLFLSEGVIIEQQYRDQAVESYAVEQPGPLRNIRLAVLVNQHTASAAEIIAGALQAHQRASLFGTQTFGKNTIQLVFDLQDGSSLHVTAAHWWIPGNEGFTSGNGLIPDVSFPPEAMSAEPNPAVVAAIDQLLR